MSSLDGVEPERLLTDPALRFSVDPAEAATRALGYAHATGARSYDEIGARLAAATPVTDVAPLQTVPSARWDRDRADRTRTDERVARVLRDQPKLRHRPLDFPQDGSYRYRVEGRMIIFTRTWSDDAGRERTDDWTFPLTAPPAALLDGTVDDDAARLFGQVYPVHLPAAYWLPLTTLIRAAAFPRMQDCRAELTDETRPGHFFCFVSHRWLTPGAPDPQGRQARFTAWQLVALLCEAVNVAGLRGLHTPRRLHPALGFELGAAGSDLAEALLVNLVRPVLDEDRLRAALAEVSTLEAETADYGVAQADADTGLRRLAAALAERPVLRELVGRIQLWYDYSCLPQPPRDAADQRLFEKGLEQLTGCQILGRTVVLLDDAEDYLSRAWCTMEALVADAATGPPDLLIGSERRRNPDGRTEHFLTTLLADRPHLAWRAVLDTEVFRVQSPAECLARLGLSATDPRDLPFIYRRLRESRAPVKVHTNASEIITGVFALPVAGDGGVIVPVSSSRPMQGPAGARPRSSLDWTGALHLASAWSDAHDPARLPPLQRVGDAGGAHVAVLAASEGEAVLFTAWVIDHRAELEEVLGTPVGSVSWLASDIAAVGEMACGTLRAAPVGARRWVLVGVQMRLRHGVIAPAIRNALADAGVAAAEVAIDRAEDNVTVFEDRSEPPDPSRSKVLPRGTVLPEHPGGLLRAHLVDRLCARADQPPAAAPRPAPTAAPGPVGDLRQAVFAAAATGAAALEQLCRQHADAITAEFDRWARVPADVRQDPGRLQRYVTVVLRVAQVLDELGHPGPMHRLTSPSDNPIVRWQQSIARARELNEAGDRDEAAALVESVLDGMRGTIGPAVTDLRPKAYGLLGLIRFDQGELAAARTWLTSALTDCRAAGDLDGVRIYTENLATLAAVEDHGAAAARRDRIARAQDLSDGLRYHASNEVLHALLDEMDPGDPLRPKAYGLLGLNLYRLGDRPGARQWTQRAVAACRAAGDDHGELVYSTNLSTIDRPVRQ
ncbi:MAG TPA: hypothetical protein VFH03_22425 [Actinoplanes sp.]|nr:hypothetical protein [Actinoplanes sp.]